MKNLTKGALTMVLAGSVTFSVANAWLEGQPSKLLAKVKAITHFEDQKTADAINADKTVKSQTPTSNVKDAQTTSSHNIAVVQTALKNGNKSEIVTASTKQNTEKFTKQATTNLTYKVTKTASTSSAPTIPTTRTSTKALKRATTTKTTSGTTKTTATTTTAPAAPTIHATSVHSKASTNKNTAGATTTTTTNHGKQVSQVEKEKHTNLDKTSNNGKNM